MRNPSLTQHSPLRRPHLDAGKSTAGAPTAWNSSQRVRPGVQRLLDAFRQRGYRCAVLDPLGQAPIADEALLTPQRFGLSPTDALTEDGSTLLGLKTVQELTTALRAIYCGTLTLDASAVRDEARLAWLHAEMETPLSSDTLPADMTGMGLLARLVHVQTWEHHVARRFPHAKRFSLEGCEALLPLLDVLVEQAGAHGVSKLVLGMPHRGRINVLVNLMGRPALDLLTYFQANYPHPEQHKDLPYHLGARHRISTRHGDIELELAANPSHLQSVQPVVAGMARASQDRGADHAPQQTLPVVMHGDAALAGQGVVMESLVMGRKHGYSVGGTVHIVINNQVGFTELNVMDAEQPRYASDVARIIDAPVLRVSADAPEQVQRAAEIALAYRTRFGSDVFIDLIGYRRHGHSEHDVPTLTAPARQARIDQLTTVVERYAARLCDAGLASELDVMRVVARAREQAIATFDLPPTEAPAFEADRAGAPDLPLPGLAQVQGIVSTLTQLPEGFQPHAMVQGLIKDWQTMSAGANARCDWRFAENMAYATLLQAGIGVRVSGMDVRRGTFMHRLAVWHGQQADGHAPAMLQPLDRLRNGPARFEIYNSQLSEEAVVGFEYGYSLHDSKRLVIWEAQFGDFVNGAQVYIDHYIAAGDAKWGCASGLTLLLPHGYEGVGPEHSSGFLGRFLQLCAQGNLQVAMPSTASQWFHLLRRQACTRPRRPLVVMSPKGKLYDEPDSHTPLQEMLDGHFSPLLDDPRAQPWDGVGRVVLSSGKLYYDLARGLRESSLAQGIALLRLEQLYPFPQADLQSLLKRYSGLKELVWAQEEELNQGAWPFIRDELANACPDGVQLRCAARPGTAAGPTVSQPIHQAEQQRLVMQALGLS
ncbi:2-oxoglutarate dehydrogenase E1 component [Hylemonella sp. W303a]|uniref:2-oxoglutarate dehydrogenase E1 component n=1 Tax=Hylemonella sp. W303a TaxID=3389873 RepID=UPI00396B4046